jgi:hypothetical protein
MSAFGNQARRLVGAALFERVKLAIVINVRLSLHTATFPIGVLGMSELNGGNLWLS